jgi:hypothetical protein
MRMGAVYAAIGLLIGAIFAIIVLQARRSALSHQALRSLAPGPDRHGRARRRARLHDLLDSSAACSRPRCTTPPPALIGGVELEVLER